MCKKNLLIVYASNSSFKLGIEMTRLKNSSEEENCDYKIKIINEDIIDFLLYKCRIKSIQFLNHNNKCLMDIFII